MKKYNLSKIMKKAWKEAKSMKEQLISKMEKITEIAKCDGWHYDVIAKDWNNYGKSRTYFSIVETRDHSTHYKKYDFGYYDNVAERYVPGRSNLESNYDLSGKRNELLN